MPYDLKEILVLPWTKSLNGKNLNERLRERKQSFPQHFTYEDKLHNRIHVLARARKAISPDLK